MNELEEIKKFKLIENVDNKTKEYLNSKISQATSEFCKKINKLKLDCLKYTEINKTEKCYILSTCGIEDIESNTNAESTCALPAIIDNLQKDKYIIIHNHPSGLPPSIKDVETFLKSNKTSILHAVTSKYDYKLIKTDETILLKDKNDNLLFNYIVKCIYEKISDNLKSFKEEKIRGFNENKNNKDDINIGTKRYYTIFFLQFLKELADVYKFETRKDKWVDS